MRIATAESKRREEGVHEFPWFLRSTGRLLATLLLAVALPLGGLAVTIGLMAGARLASAAVEQNQSEADLAAQALALHFDSILRHAEIFARRATLVDAVTRRDIDAARRILREMVEENPQVDRAFVVDREGVEWCDWPTDPEVIGKSFAHRDWYLGVTSTGKSYLSEAYRRAARPSGVRVAAATVVREARGGAIGYLVGQISLRQIATPIENAHPGRRGAIRLVDQHGHLVLDQVGDEDVANVSSHPLLRAPVTDARDARKGPDLVTGEESLVSLKRVDAYGWIVAVGQPVDSVHAPIRAFQVGIGVATLLSFLLLVGLGFLWLDIVRRKHAAMLALEETKDRLTQMLVHDLRNPLSALVGSLELAAADAENADPAVTKNLDLARSSVTQLIHMTQLLVDVGRLEDGQMPLELRAGDLAKLVRAKAREYEASCTARGVDLVVEAPDRLDATIDVTMVERVLENLLTNAIKHTPSAGRVTLSLSGRPATGMAEIQVGDTGEGIAPDQLALLFTKYGRVEGQKLSSRTDTGLGLVFCRMAVELHGGRIDVESEVGQGARFRIVLPIRPPVPEVKATPSNAVERPRDHD